MAGRFNYRVRKARAKIVCCALLLVCLLQLLACSQKIEATSVGTGNGRPLKIGIDGSPLLGPLYAAARPRAETGIPNWSLVRFGSDGDIGYALLAGKLDAGFVETNKGLKLLQAPGGNGLKVAGALQFPYGATLVLRKDLNLRLGDLAGRTIAAQEPDCKLLHQFRKDALRAGVKPGDVQVKFMPFDEMIPALEAKTVDAVLVKGSYALVAQNLGHKVLYQNWDIKAGDDCCPAALAQTDYFLLVRETAVDSLKPLLRELVATGDLPPAQLRHAISRQIGYPLAALEQFPLATYAPVSGDLRKTLGERQCARSL
jgi:ABC-type nitrate/sulfonate/bicarbonate transport system substrate-binding protein